jgi:preprotein translocase subunit SecY
MQSFFEKISMVFHDPNLRKRVLFVLGALAVFRFLANIPIPGINTVRLAEVLAGNQVLGLFNVFSGGGLTNLSIVMLGVGPYITSSIVMQLLTVMSPRLKAMYQEEGELGRKKFSQYSRYLTIPLALIQAFAFIILLTRQGVVANLSPLSMITNIIIVTAGSLFLMWLGELMTEFGIGNGTSIIIFSGIVARLPATIAQLRASFDPSQIPLILGFIILAGAIIYAVVFVTEAERPIPITYAKRVRGMKVYGGVSTYLPLRLNQSGVMPIIFAISILLFPQMILSFLSGLQNQALKTISDAINSFLANQLVYGLFYFLLVFIFTYFYTAVTFDPNQIATNLQKGGAFIPGVRPGDPTSQHILRILTRITMVGALFLGFIAVLPIAVQALTHITYLTIGGTALLIAVSVILDLVKKIDAQLSMREY